MELPRRARSDELLPAGALTALRRELRPGATRQDLTAVVACAFDHRTRMLPFVYADTRMAPAGVRAIGSALLDADVVKTRIVLQQWNPRFRPVTMQLDGRIPDLFLVSSMQLHTAAFQSLLRDACRIDSARRPLIIAGGPKVIYEPWDAFSADPTDPWAADVAITGEEYVLLDLLRVLLSERASGESLRSAFSRARNGGVLDNIPGLVYARADEAGMASELIDTGMQRLLGDLDELPHPVLGYQILEPPSRRTTLGARPIPPERVGRYSPLGSLVLTFGCKFACPYCPIPAYNQRQHRTKSGLRIADEMTRLHDTYNIRHFFGADDNFFNNEQRTREIIETLANTTIGGVPIRKRIRWGTEVTVHDTIRLKDDLADVRRAGVRALWLGVEDMTATLIKKGQSVSNTIEAFELLSQHGIQPMPMMMHHDEQPLITRGAKPYGLLNQVHLLRKAKAGSLQVLMLVPATGSKLYMPTYTSGMVYDSVAGKTIEEYMLGGNMVVASHHAKPWRKQLNILVAYAYFYNPLRLLIALVRPKNRLYLADAVQQALGMFGLAQTVRRTAGWAWRLWRGPIRRRHVPPRSEIPMRSVGGGPADHALPGTPIAGQEKPAESEAQVAAPADG